MTYLQELSIYYNNFLCIQKHYIAVPVSKFLKAGVSDSKDIPFFEKSLYQIEVKESENLHEPFTKITSENHNEGEYVFFY